MIKPPFLATRGKEGPIRQFIGDESGIAVTEYGLLIALVAILLIGVVTLFASQIASWFSAKTSQITSL
jgi:Flp pilus assembly pilin Flp